MAGVYSKYFQIRDLTLILKEFKLNCQSISSFHSDALDDSIFIVGSDIVSLTFEEAVNRVLFFYRNDIVAN